MIVHIRYPTNRGMRKQSIPGGSLGPRPSRTRKSVWGLSHDFLVVLTRHILKPMRTPARCRLTEIETQYLLVPRLGKELLHSARDTAIFHVTAESAQSEISQAHRRVRAYEKVT